MKGVKGGRGKEGRGKKGRISWALGTASLWAPRNVNHKLGILEFNITIADIHTGARFPADCTNRADVAAADPRNAPPVMLLMLLMLILSSGQGSLELLEKWPQGGKPMLDLLWRQKGGRSDVSLIISSDV